MPFFDKFNKFSDGQDLASASSITYSTYELDFGATYDRPGASANTHPDLGAGTELVIRFMVETTFTVITYLEIGLFHSTTGTLTTLLLSTKDIALASLTKGAYLPEMKIPDQHYRYMRIGYTPTGTVGAGAITAYISPATGLRHR